MNDTALKAALEAVLFASGSPVTTEKLSEIFDLPEARIASVASVLAEDMKESDRGIELITVDNAYQLCTKPLFAAHVKRALELRKTPPLTKAALEVLAITAYNQPVPRSYIEAVRGVDSSSIVSSLCDKGLIYESGQLDAPGRPALFSTTSAFLRCFGLESLDQLPALTEQNENSENITLDEAIGNASDGTAVAEDSGQ